MEDYTDAELIALGGTEMEDVAGSYSDVLFKDIVGTGGPEEGSGALDGEVLGPEDDAGIHEVRPS